jgi:molybdate transport system ATP-binding protein
MLDMQVRRQQGAFTVEATIKQTEMGITALFGSSGAGKTSIVNMLAGLRRPDTGHIVINSRCLFDSAKGIDLPVHRRRIGYVFQDGRLLPHLSVRANLNFGLRLTPAERRYISFDAVVDLLGIGHLLDRRPAKLSGGEKQRVAIGRALLTSPELLLMDEPLASLDSARKSEVLPFIRRLSREFRVPIIYVSHALEEILNIADHLVVMEGGRVIVSGSVGSILTVEQISQNHCGLAGVHLNVDSPLLAASGKSASPASETIEGQPFFALVKGMTALCGSIPRP